MPVREVSNKKSLHTPTLSLAEIYLGNGSENPPCGRLSGALTVKRQLRLVHLSWQKTKSRNRKKSVTSLLEKNGSIMASAGNQMTLNNTFSQNIPFIRSVCASINEADLFSFFSNSNPVDITGFMLACRVSDINMCPYVNKCIHSEPIQLLIP